MIAKTQLMTISYLHGELQMLRLVCLVAFCGLLIGCGPSTPDTTNGTTAPDNTTSPEATPTVAGEETQVSIHVPNMHCPHACWPAIKETLEGEGGVAEVTLAEQAEEDKIDNPRVMVTLNGPFDGAKAVEALTAAGFADSEIE
jgi:copper chaperone CopZ